MKSLFLLWSSAGGSEIGLEIVAVKAGILYKPFKFSEDKISGPDGLYL